MYSLLRSVCGLKTRLQFSLAFPSYWFFIGFRRFVADEDA